MITWYRIALCSFALMAAGTSGAWAAETLRGTVVSVDTKAQSAVVSHESFDGMPAMTMPFALDAPDARRLHAGDRITANVDRRLTPWRLRVVGVAQATPALLPHVWVPLLRPGDEMPNARFIDQDGRSRTWREFANHTVVVSFIYTRCRDASMCPLISAKFHELQSLLPADARLVEVTLDPLYDTPAVLRRYGSLFGADSRRWTFATGDVESALELSRRFGIGILSNNGTTIAHSEAVGVIGPDQRIVAVVGGNQWQPQEIAALVRQSEGLQSNAWQRFVLFVRQAPRACGISDPVTARIAWGVFIAAFVPVSLVLLRLLREGIRQANQ